MLESDDFGDLLLFMFVFYLVLILRLSSFKFNSYLNDFFLLFFETISSSISSKNPLLSPFYILYYVFTGIFKDGTSFFCFWFKVLPNYLLFGCSSGPFLNSYPVKFSPGTNFFGSPYFLLSGLDFLLLSAFFSFYFSFFFYSYFC